MRGETPRGGADFFTAKGLGCLVLGRQLCDVYPLQRSIHKAILKGRSTMKVTAGQMQAIWKSIHEPLRKKRDASRLIARIAFEGWASLPDIEDIFYLTDDRIDSMRHEMSVEDWCKAIGIPVQTAYRRPRSKEASTVGMRGVRAEDVADLLMQLERVGYSVDPLPLIEAIIEPIRQKHKITDSELSVLWYAKKRHKMEPLSVTLEGKWQHRSASERFKTATGYTVEAWLDEAAKPFQLEVRAPKFRSRPASKKETCAVCGYEWYRGDPDSSRAHRRAHKERLSYLDPKPVPQFVAELTAGGDAEFVACTSPTWKHREIYKRAVAFRREFHYDFVQWDSPKGDSDPGVHGFLFANDDKIIVGACAFRRRREAEEQYWGLQWIWVAPKYRRIGVISKRWASFRKRFGDFYIEPPVSEAMQGFLDKIGDSDLMSVSAMKAKKYLEIVELVTESRG